MDNIIKAIKRLITGGDQPAHPDNYGSDANPAKKDNASNQVTQRDSSRAPFREIKTSYLAFDLEIAKAVPGDFNNWQNFRPLGISCAATICDGEAPRLWFSKYPDGRIAPKLIEKDSFQLAAYLYQAMKKGWNIVTWNGLGFDFQILAEESDYWDLCTELALDHIDMMFQIFCIKGYPLALNKAALGMQLPGKLEGVSGEMAPILWQQGQYEKVLQYVEQDARTTLDVAKAGLYHKKIHWTSNSGTYQTVDFPDGWKHVKEVIKLPKPDTSWMRNPIERSEFYQWIFDYRKAMEDYDLQAERNGYGPDAGPIQPEPLITNSPAKEPEVSEDEINWLFAQCDQPWETDPLTQPQPAKRTQRGFSYVSGCNCPICRGVPNLDFRFLLDEDDNGYWDRYDDYNDDNQ